MLIIGGDSLAHLLAKAKSGFGAAISAHSGKCAAPLDQTVGSGGPLGQVVAIFIRDVVARVCDCCSNRRRTKLRRAHAVLNFEPE